MEATNQNPLKFKTLGNNVIFRPLSPPALTFAQIVGGKLIFSYFVCHTVSQESKGIR